LRFFAFWWPQLSSMVPRITYYNKDLWIILFYRLLHALFFKSLNVSSVYHVPIYQIKLCVLWWWLTVFFNISRTFFYDYDESMFKRTFLKYIVETWFALYSTIICSHLQNSPTFNLKQLSLKHKHPLLVTVLTCLLLFQVQYAHAFPDIQPFTLRIIPFV
jgi:hypothetical protein